MASLVMLGCSSQSKFVKIDSSNITGGKSAEEVHEFQDSDAQSSQEGIDDYKPSEWMADLDLPQEDPVEENMEDAPTVDGEVETPIMITGAYLVSCNSIDGLIECIAEVEAGADIAGIEVLDQSGEPIPPEQFEITSVEEDGVLKVLITLIPLDPEPEEQEVAEPELSDLERCELEGLVWDLDATMCLDLSQLSDEELCLRKDGFYWSSPDSLCIADGTVFGQTVSLENVNMNIPLGDPPIDVAFNLAQTSYVRFVDVYTDWWSKRPTDIKVYQSIEGVKGELIAEQNFPTRDDQICGVDYLSTCSATEAPVSRLTVTLDKLYAFDAVIVEVGGLLGQSQGFSIIKDVGLRN